MRQVIGLVSLVAALSLPGCDVDLSGVRQPGSRDYNFGDGGGFGVILTPDSLRLQVGEVAEVKTTGLGFIGVYWSVSDSAIVRVPEGLSGPFASLSSTTEVTAIQSGEAWVIGTSISHDADSVWVVVECSSDVSGCNPIFPDLGLSFAFEDPTRDHLQLTPVRQQNPPPQEGVIDLVGLHFTFDGTTGDYEITLTASGANPFAGGFRVNVAMFNPDTGTTAQDPAFLEVSDDFFLTAPSMAITLTGTDPKLLSWEAGDRVAPCEGSGFEELGPCLGSLGLPDGVRGFGTGVYTQHTPPVPNSPKGTDDIRSGPATIGN